MEFRTAYTSAKERQRNNLVNISVSSMVLSRIARISGYPRDASRILVLYRNALPRPYQQKLERNISSTKIVESTATCCLIPKQGCDSEATRFAVEI
jgi:hypothetical protein